MEWVLVLITRTYSICPWTRTQCQMATKSELPPVLWSKLFQLFNFGSAGWFRMNQKAVRFDIDLQLWLRGRRRCLIQLARRLWKNDRPIDWHSACDSQTQMVTVHCFLSSFVWACCHCGSFEFAMALQLSKLQNELFAESVAWNVKTFTAV